MDRNSPIVATLLACFVAATLVPSGALAEPAASTQVQTALDEATRRVLELEQAIEDHRAEAVAIEERIAVTNLRIIAQRDALAEARHSLVSARTAYRFRMVDIYKSSMADPMTVLLSAESMSDFYSRLLMLTRIAMRDRRMYEEATVAAAAAEYHAAYLEDLKAQDVALRQLQRLRGDELEKALAEQSTLVERLTEEAKRLLEARRRANLSTRKQWRESSIPLEDAIAKVPGVVEPYTDLVYLVSEYHPRRYRSLGREEYALCSWYGNEFHGRPTASGQIYNQNDFTCASRTLPFGTRLALTRGERRIVVVVTDRGPFIAGRDLDLSRAAAQALGFSGLATVHVEYVEAIRE